MVLKNKLCLPLETPILYQKETAKKVAKNLTFLSVIDIFEPWEKV